MWFTMSCPAYPGVGFPARSVEIIPFWNAPTICITAAKSICGFILGIVTYIISWNLFFTPSIAAAS